VARLLPMPGVATPASLHIAIECARVNAHSSTVELLRAYARNNNGALE